MLGEPQDQPLETIRLEPGECAVAFSGVHFL